MQNYSFAGSNSGADFLKLPVDAQSIALGQAVTALSEGPASLNTNPAGINTLSAPGQPSVGMAFSRQDLFFDSTLEHLSLAMPSRSGRGGLSLGLSISRVSYADQEFRGADGRSAGTFGSSDMALGLALGTRLQRFQLGSQVRFIRQDLAGEEATGVSVDLGVLAPTPIHALSLGASVRNLGPRMKFVDESFDLPLTISVGAAYRLTGPFTMTVDVQSRPHQDQVVMAIGTQVQAVNAVTLRAGYLSKLAEAISPDAQSDGENNALGGISGVNAGLGINFSQFSLDYAISPFGELGNTHNLTISTWFGGAQATPADKVESPSNRLLVPLEPQIFPQTPLEEDRSTILSLNPADF